MAQKEVKQPLRNEYDPLTEIHKRDQEKLDRIKKAKKQHRKKFLVSCLIVCLIIAGYFSLDFSKVQNIIVTGNDYLSKKTITDLAGVNYESRALLIFPSYVEKHLENSKLIEKATVSVDIDRQVTITVEMKKALGYFWHNDAPYILLSDGSLVYLANDLNSTITDLPLIRDDTSDEDLKLLTQAMKDLEPKTIAGIAEIWRYHASYDDHMYRFLMNNGNQVFTNFDSVGLLENYNNIVSQAGLQNSCLILSASTLSGYLRSCEELNNEEKAALEADSTAES